MTLTVRAITADRHREWIASRPFTSFLQLPEGGLVKRWWRSESIGWFEASRMVCAGLVMPMGRSLPTCAQEARTLPKLIHSGRLRVLLRIHERPTDG